MRLLVTGGAGFIGSAFVRLLLGGRGVTELLNFDKLTYAGNLENVEAVAQDPRYRFVRGDIADAKAVNAVLEDFRPDAIVHFAAESHVDRSIFAPDSVFETNLRGTFTLLEAVRAHRIGRFLHVSTDEVYGSVEAPLVADEAYPVRPSSPYSAAKAGSDLLVLSYFTTYQLPVMVTRASNNYGPYQFPEKLIPLMIMNALEGRRLPVYGDGTQVRDWLYVDDHCRAIASVLERGREGEVYNVGGTRALPNIEIVRKILRSTGRTEELIEYVRDRPGHDRRYAITSEKTTRETGWEPQVVFEEGLDRTIAWYRDNPGWLERVKSGAYQTYYERNYRDRELEIERLRKR